MIAQFLSPARHLRAAFVLVVVACATPDRAEAGCGDYVTILNGESGTASHSPMPGHDSPAPVPCQGPNCSGAPVKHTPPTAPPGSVVSQVKHLVPTLELPAACGSPCFRVDRHSRSLPIDRPSSIFHPPRLG